MSRMLIISEGEKLNIQKMYGLINEQTQSLTDELIIDIINNTISAGGSKNYDDLFYDSLGLTAVGILHFTKSGLKKLYRVMDTEKYFGKSYDEMSDSIKDYKGKELDDPEWVKGMKTFLNSSESISVQNKAATSKFRRPLEEIISSHGWNTAREYAVAMFYLNSYPACLKPIGNKYNWDAEQMLRAYCEGECSEVSACRNRCNHINKNLPNTKKTEGYVWKGC